MTPRMYKIAMSTIDMENHINAGKGISNIVKFLISRADPSKRNEYLYKVRQKVQQLNAAEMASKDMPQSASIGQAITFIKTVLNGKPAHFVKLVLDEIIKNLG